MFEFIGILFAIWIGYCILRALFRASSRSSSNEFGMEARRISVAELGVPSSYYNHMVVNNIDAIKNSALLLRDTNEDFSKSSWPRLLALVIYGEFHQDCEQWQFGNPIKEQLFHTIGVSSEELSNELVRDPRSVIFGSR